VTPPDDEPGTEPLAAVDEEVEVVYLGSEPTIGSENYIG